MKGIMENKFMTDKERRIKLYLDDLKGVLFEISKGFINLM